jgi:hypothetical protein
MNKVTIAAICLALSVAVQAAHADNSSVAPLHKVVGTAIDWNGAVTGVSGGTTAIDTANVKCANASGCIIGVAAMVQTISNGSGGQWEICVLVDGSQASPGCPTQGIVPTSNYVVGNLRTNTPVATGTHTVVTEIVMPDAGSIAARESDITVYKD